MGESISKTVEGESRRTDRERIDQQFEAMAGDEEYLREMVEVDAAWSAGSDEALRIYLAECGEMSRS